jgi:DNA-binding NarL/FixJ family response regulator
VESKKLPRSLWFRDAEPAEPFPPMSECCTSCAVLTARLVEAQELWKKATVMASWALNLQESIVDMHRVPAPRGAADDTLAALTPREQEVLHWVSRGLTNRQIARTLGIVEKTVKNHLYAIFAKLGVSDRTQAALFAINVSAAR